MNNLVMWWCWGNILERMCNNTPINAIVNAVSNISYRLLLETIIQTTYTGRCYRPRFCSTFFINNLKNLTKVVIEKIGKLSQTKLFLRLFYVRNHNIIVAQVRYIIIETREVGRIGYNGLLFQNSINYSHIYFIFK